MQHLKLSLAGTLELLLIILYFRIILLHEWLGIFNRRAAIHWVGNKKGVWRWAGRYPERRRFMVHVGRGVVYLWLSWSPDEPTTYPMR